MKEGLDLNPDRWPDVSRIFAEAAGLNGPSRNAYLDDACWHDPALRAAVESLLGAHDNAGSFGETPGVAPPGTVKRLAPDSQLGPFRIESFLGAGGMGEVYRAYDTKLQRAVAIKVLPDFLAHDPNRLARFEEEARALAALNHPHVGAIYGLEESAAVVGLVLELVEGPTLAERLAGGPLRFDAVVRIARQLAEGLEAAHERGIVHRDLKPANIKITPDGNVKILDFGLAKTAGTSPGAAFAPSPTKTREATQCGTVLGTEGYMSPEQARGQTVDKRTDIWAFGCVLFEMCAHQPPFAGATIDDAHAAAIEREPDWNLLRAGTPANLVRLLRRCLITDPKLRLRDIGEARIALEQDTDNAIVAPRSTTIHVAAIAAILGSVALAFIAAVAVLSSPASIVTRLDVALPYGDVFLTGDDRIGWGGPAITPDGRTLFYVAVRGGNAYVFRRQLDDPDPKIVAGTEGAVRVYMYPAGDWLAFSTNPEGIVKKVSLSGGPPATVFKPKWRILGLDFTSPHEIVIGDHGYGLFRVPAAGGEPVSMLPRTSEGPPRFPVALPGGRGLLLTVGSVPVANRIAVLPAGSTSVRVLTSGTDARYLDTGHVLFWRDGSLWAARFDLDRLELSSDPVPVVDRVGVTNNGAGLFAVSATGTLAYMSAVDPPARTLVWVDRDGRETALGAPPGPYMAPRLSPDGRKVLLGYRSGRSDDIWLHDIARQVTQAFIAEPESEWTSLWTKDGKGVLFSSRRPGGFRMYTKGVNEPGIGERIGSEIPNTDGLTPDGTAMLFHMSPTQQSGHPAIGQPDDDSRSTAVPKSNGAGDTMFTSPITGGTATALWTDEFAIFDARFSPDGHWIAYCAGPPGAKQVWIRPYPNVHSNSWQVSPDGGQSPRWSTDSGTFYYRRGADMMAVSVGAGPGVPPGPPKKLFDGPYQDDFDIASDGRFLMIKEPASPPPPERRIIVVLNWIQELKERLSKR